MWHDYEYMESRRCLHCGESEGHHRVNTQACPIAKTNKYHKHQKFKLDTERQREAAIKRAKEREESLKPARICFKCAYYQRYTCRRYPPQFHHAVVVGRAGDVAGWPEVSETNWCGEFKSKDTEEVAE